MRVIVSGGREFTDEDMLFAALDRFHAEQPISLLIHGAARGADTLAGAWAKSRSVPVAAFPADWTKHGRAAGPIRNRQMLDEGRPDAVIAFPGGTGTANMKSQARAQGAKVFIPAAPQAPAGPPDHN